MTASATPVSGYLMHGKKWTSVADCNLAQGAGMFMLIMEKIMGLRGRVGCAAYRGTAAEHGVTLGLMDLDMPLADCQAAAVKEFDKLSALSTDPNREKEREAIPGIVEQALEELRQYGKPSSVQQEIIWQHPDLPVPFKGYADFVWSEHGVILDLKSQLRLSSEVSPQHARQVSLYGAAISDNYDLRIAYCTPKKRAVYRVENAKQHLDALVNIAQRIDRFLALDPDPKQLLKLCIPNPDTFYAADPDTRQRMFELSGI